MRILFILLIPVSAFAAGAGGPMDFIPSFVNIIILISLIVFLLKDKLRAHFKTKSEETASQVEMAAAKAKEAKVMMEREQKKMQAVDAEISSLKNDVNSQLGHFEAEYKTSIESRISNLKSDAAQKIESERKDLLNELNSTLLDQVIGKSKGILKANPELNTEAARNMIKGLK